MLTFTKIAHTLREAKWLAHTDYDLYFPFIEKYIEKVEIYVLRELFAISDEIGYSIRITVKCSEDQLAQIQQKIDEVDHLPFEDKMQLAKKHFTIPDAPFQSIDYVIEYASPVDMINTAIKLFREGTRTFPTSVHLNPAHKTGNPPLTTQKVYPSKYTIRDKHDVRFEYVNICFSEDVTMECVRCIREAKPQ